MSPTPLLYQEGNWQSPIPSRGDSVSAPLVEEHERHGEACAKKVWPEDELGYQIVAVLRKAVPFQGEEQGIGSYAKDRRIKHEVKVLDINNIAGSHFAAQVDLRH